MTSSDKEFSEWDQTIDDIHSDKQKLKDEMKTKLKENDSNAQVLYRLAKVNMFLSKSAQNANNKEFEKSFATEALSYAEKACKAEPQNPECHKWMCASVGKLATLSSAKEKIRFGHEFKEHADIALKLKPDDPFMQSLYGQWCYNVASLSWIEKRMAQTVYGNIPEANYDMALNAFKKVNELNPKSKENHLWMARTLIALKKTPEAKDWIKNGLTLQNKNVSDEVSHKELEELNKKYN